MYLGTILYFGRMLSPDAQNRISSEPDIERFLSKVAKDRWVLHAPSRKIIMGSVDPVLEEHEKRRGFVTFNDIDKWLAKHKAEQQLWSAATESDLSRLDHLVMLAAGGAPNAKSGVYICEISWTTYTWPEGDEGALTYNIRALP